MITLHTLSVEDYKKLVAKILFGRKGRELPYVDSIGMSRLGAGLILKDHPRSRIEVFKTMGLEEARLDNQNPNYKQQLAKERRLYH